MPPGLRAFAPEKPQAMVKLVPKKHPGVKVRPSAPSRCFVGLSGPRRLILADNRTFSGPCTTKHRAGRARASNGSDSTRSRRHTARMRGAASPWPLDNGGFYSVRMYLAARSLPLSARISAFFYRMGCRGPSCWMGLHLAASDALHVRAAFVSNFALLAPHFLLPLVYCIHLKGCN